MGVVYFLRYRACARRAGTALEIMREQGSCVFVASWRSMSFAAVEGYPRYEIGMTSVYTMCLVIC